MNLSAVGTSVDKAMKKLDALVSYKKNAAPIRAINEYFDTGARDKYLGIGAPVLTYGDYDAGTHYKHPNYVTFDDRLLEILRKARMADPGLLKTKP